MHVKKRKTAFFDTSEEAYAHEKELIQFYGIENLTNITLGGDGGCLPVTIADRKFLEQAYLEANVTWDDLASVLGTSANTLAKMMRGESIGYRTAIRLNESLSRIFECEINLIDGKGLETYREQCQILTKELQFEKRRRHLEIIEHTDWSKVSPLACERIAKILTGCIVQVEELEGVTIVPPRPGRPKKKQEGPGK